MELWDGMPPCLIVVDGQLTQILGRAPNKGMSIWTIFTPPPKKCIQCIITNIYIYINYHHNNISIYIYPTQYCISFKCQIQRKLAGWWKSANAMIGRLNICVTLSRQSPTPSTQPGVPCRDFAIVQLPAKVTRADAAGPDGHFFSGGGGGETGTGVISCILVYCIHTIFGVTCFLLEISCTREIKC